MGKEELMKELSDQIAQHLDSRGHVAFALMFMEVTEDGTIGRTTYRSNVDRDVMIAVFEAMAKMLRDSPNSSIN